MNKNKLLTDTVYNLLDTCFESNEAEILKNAADLMRKTDPLGHISTIQLEAVYTICKYIKPVFEDVLTVFLWPGVYLTSINKQSVKKLGIDGFDDFYKRICDIDLIDKNGQKKLEEEDLKTINKRIFIGVCDKLLLDITEPMKKRGFSVDDVRKAYNKAKQLHGSTDRATHEPYITHPLRVAKRLSDVDMDSSIIVSALLHDTVEDTPYTKEDLKNDFGLVPANYVEAVTALNEELDCSGIDKHEIDEKTFDKLVQHIRKEPNGLAALYIKAADRIDNLSTMETMTEEKKLNKIYETERQYLRLFDKYGMNYFVGIIDDLIFKLRDPNGYEKVSSDYNNALVREKCHIDSFVELFNKELNKRIDTIKSIIVSECDLSFKSVKRSYTANEIKDISNALRSNIGAKKVPLCQINTVISVSNTTGFDITDFGNALMKLYKECFVKHGYIILNYQLKSNSILVLTIEDMYKNRFECTFSKKEDWIRYNLGTTEGIIIEDEFDRFPDDYSGPYITVYKRDGSPIKLPINSTPIDLAFSIHSDIGFKLTGAIANGARIRIYDKLHDNDFVVLEYDPVFVQARINWLFEVATSFAKKTLIQYFSKKYEGDDPRYNYRISDKTLMKYLDSIKERIKIKDLPND